MLDTIKALFHPHDALIATSEVAEKLVDLLAVFAEYRLHGTDPMVAAIDALIQILQQEKEIHQGPQ